MCVEQGVVPDAELNPGSIMMGLPQQFHHKERLRQVGPRVGRGIPGQIRATPGDRLQGKRWT